MTFKEFSQYIEQMQNIYDKKLNKTQSAIWYESLKFMTVERFNYILADIYKTNQYMPTLAEILEKHKSIPYTVGENKKEIKRECKQCGNSGYITYTKLVDGREYTYVATCSCGRQKPFADNKYRMKTSEEIGFNEEVNIPDEKTIIEAMVKLSNSGMVSEKFKEMMRKNILKRREQRV